MSHAADSVTFSTITDPSETEVVARLVSLAFGGDLPGCREWIAAGGVGNLRVLRDARAGVPPIPACMLRIPMGVYLGGARVPMLGVAGVAVGPESRGQGFALRMMRESMIQAAADGWPLAGLYASTQALYRQVGFEQAGDRCAITLKLGQLGLRERGSPITPISDADMPEVKACYDAHAPRHDGTLARSDYIWNRIRKWRDAVYTGFATRDASGRIDGYLFMNQKRKDNGKMDLALSDFCALSASAYRRLLGFLADFAMMADTATFHAGPHHPALMLLPQQSFEIKHHEFWMFRVLDVKRAMELRGWPRGVAAEISLDVNDPLLGANHGRWVLRVRDGKAIAERGGDGAICVDVRGLAPLLTGLQTVRGLVLGGLAEAGDEAIRDAAAVFPGGMPWTSDFY